MSTDTQSTAGYRYICYEERGAVALLRYNRPQSRNAWNVGLTREVIDAIKQANAAEQVRAIVLTGNGTVFCAGVDIKAPPEPKDETGRSPNPSSLTMGQGENNWLQLLNESKPVIAAVNGPAIGLGVTHILGADIRLAAQSATFSFPFVRLGAMPECGSTALLARIVGFGRAMDLCLRAGEITAAEALQIGLVTQICPDDRLLEEALALAQRIAGFPPLQIGLTKRMLWEHTARFQPDEIMRGESSTFVKMLQASGRAKNF